MTRARFSMFADGLGVDLNGPYVLHSDMVAMDDALRLAAETLKAMRPCIEGYIDRCDYTKGNQALAMLDAAIAKAEGR